MAQSASLYPFPIFINENTQRKETGRLNNRLSQRNQLDSGADSQENEESLWVDVAQFTRSSSLRQKLESASRFL